MTELHRQRRGEKIWVDLHLMIPHPPAMTVELVYYPFCNFAAEHGIPPDRLYTRAVGTSSKLQDADHP